MILTPEIGEIPRFPVIPLEKKSFRNGILVRTPNWLGDAVMCIPALTMVRSLLPETCGLFVAVPALFEGLFDALGFVDRIIPLKDAHAFPLRSERELMHSLQPGIGILFNNSFRDALALKWTGIPSLYGAGARFRSFLLKRSFPFSPRLDHTLNKPHQAAKYMSIPLAMGAREWDGVFPELKPLCFEETFSDPLRRAMKMKNVLAVASGAAYGQAKCWTEDEFASVCRLWAENGGSVVMLGTGKERSAADKILRGLPAERTENLAGETSISELILFLKHASAVLANDSGIMHLAAGCGTPGAAPFGSTDPSATSPVSGKWRIVFNKQECSPCFKRVCPKGTKACFAGIHAREVFELLRSLTGR